MVANKALIKILRRPDFQKALKSAVLPARLQSLLSAKVKKIDSMFFLGPLAKGRPKLGDLDRTGREAEVNHVAISDYLQQNGRSSRPLQLAIAWKYGIGLYEHLRATLPGRRFHVILDLGDTCTVRFHLARADATFLTDDLEGYKAPTLSLVTDSPAAEHFLATHDLR